MATNNAINNKSEPLSSTTLTLTGNVELPTTSSTVGQIKINSATWAHAYGTANVFIGGAGNFTLNTTNAKDNVGIAGSLCLDSLVGTNSGEGANNVCIGTGSGHALTSGNNNTFLGISGGQNVTTGTNNVCIGFGSGYSSFTTGSYNVLIGASTGPTLATSDSSNIMIGYGVDLPAGTDNFLAIGSGTGTGDGQINTCRISGITGKTSTSGAAVYCNSSNTLGTSTSNRDSKQDIADITDQEADILYNLRVRTFKFKNDTDPKPRQFGLIAEEVEEFFPEMVIYDKDGKPWNLAYQFLAPMLVKEVQRLNARIKALEEK